MISKKFLYIITVVSAFIIFSGCGDSNSDTDESRLITVSGVKIKAEPTSEIIEINGNVEGIQRVKLSTKLMGTISYFPFKAGAKIKKDQVLVKINSADILAKKQQVKANILQTQAALKNMEINYNRVKSLFDKKSATAKEMEDIQMAYDMAKAQADGAREMEKEIDDVLSYSVIKAPFNGYIVNKFFEEGDLTAPGHPLMIVENFSSFKIKASVSASYINRIKNGDPVKIRVDELKGELFSGMISSINPGAHPASRQYDVEISIDENLKNSGTLKSGMYAKIFIEDQTRNRILIDKNNLIKKGQLKGVYTLSMNQEVLLRWLRLGKVINGKVEVLSGLSEGDIVILDKNVYEGLKVEVKL